MPYDITKNKHVSVTEIVDVEETDRREIESELDRRFREAEEALLKEEEIERMCDRYIAYLYGEELD